MQTNSQLIHNYPPVQTQEARPISVGQCQRGEQPDSSFPDFETSNVISKNEPIQSHKRQEGQIDQFFNRMNELGYQASNASQTFFMDNSNCMPNFKQRTVEDNPSSPQKPVQSPNVNESTKECHNEFQRQLKDRIRRKVDQIEMQVASCNFEKYRIMDIVKDYQERMKSIVKSIVNEWELKLEEYANQTHEKMQSLQAELQLYVHKCDQLLKQKEAEEVHSSILGENIQELQQTNKHLNRQIEDIQTQNHVLKNEVYHSSNAMESIEVLQQEIANLNKTIDQNSEYIFDLEQKVAGAALQTQERGYELKRQFERDLEDEREKMQSQYKEQFESIQDQIQRRIQEQLQSQYQGSLDNLHKKYKQQMEQLRLKLKQFQEQNLKLNSANRQYQSKLHEAEQRQMASRSQPIYKELGNSRMSQEVQHQLRQKDDMICFYKDLATNSRERTSRERVSRERGGQYVKKTPNIVVIDQESSLYIHKEGAISPSSSLAALYHNGIKQAPTRAQKINTILSRIKVRQSNSVLGSLNDMSISRESIKCINQSIIHPVSPESIIMERQKNTRMRNISHKLQQLRADIRREIGMISN